MWQWIIDRANEVPAAAVGAVIFAALVYCANWIRQQVKKVSNALTNWSDFDPKAVAKILIEKQDTFLSNQERQCNRLGEIVEGTRQLLHVSRASDEKLSEQNKFAEETATAVKKVANGH